MTKPHCICFISAKGGSGKTVLSASMARALAAVGERVTIADCDAATNGLTLLYLPELNRLKELEPYPHHGLFDDDDGHDNGPDSVRLDTHLELVPATYYMNPTERTPESVLSQALERLVTRLSGDGGLGSNDEPGILILDAQAGTDAFASVAVKFADQVIIVSEYDPVSGVGIERLKVDFASLMPRGETWTLYNKLLPEYATELGDFLRVAAVLPPIGWNADVIRAFARRDLALDLENGNAYTLGIFAVADALLPERVHTKVSRWRSSRDSAIREPIRSRISEIDFETERLERSLVEVGYDVKMSERSFLSQPVVLAGLTMVGAIIAGSAAILASGISISLVIAGAGFGTAAVLTVAVSYWSALRQNSLRRSAVDMQTQYRVLERRLKDLLDERARYHALMETTTESLLSGRADLQH